MSLGARLPVLRPDFPPMRCDEGCRECCHEPVPVSEDEMVRVILYANEHGLLPGDDSSVCPWFQGGRCSVYEARPFICQAFGHVEELECPRGYNTNVDSRAVEDVMKTKGPPVRFLHEATGRTDWMDRVNPIVWDGVARARARAGLPPFEAPPSEVG